MNLANKIFKNNITGESIKVLDSFENIAILENKQKIDVTTLMDNNKYTEQVDLTSFFNPEGAYNSLAEKIKSIPIDGMIDENISERFGGDIRPAIEESAIIMSTEEEEMAELARKYGVENNTNDLERQQQTFSKILDGDNGEVTRIDVTDNIQQPQSAHRVNIDDPITTMFRNVKRNVDFKMNVVISNKIPRLDFIEMMEDSYEISIINFLADEFTNNLLKNPSEIKEMIKSRIKQVVYGADIIEKKNIVTNLPINDVEKVKEVVKKIRKPRKNSVKTIENQPEKK